MKLTTDVCFVTNPQNGKHLLKLWWYDRSKFSGLNSSKHSCLLYSQQENKVNLTDVKNVMLICVLLHALWIITLRIICVDSVLVWDNHSNHVAATRIKQVPPPSPLPPSYETFFCLAIRLPVLLVRWQPCMELTGPDTPSFIMNFFTMIVFFCNFKNF
jgi:hypothetical protein